MKSVPNEKGPKKETYHPSTLLLLGGASGQVTEGIVVLIEIPALFCGHWNYNFGIW